MDIRIQTRDLGDGSQVYNVTMTGVEGHLCLHAVTNADAMELCAKLAEAIETHTVDTVDSDH